MTKRIAIVGAGITGLVTAYHLDQRPEFEPVLLEKRDRPGGRIDSIRREGYLLERGPHTIVEKNIETARLVDDLGLESEMVVAGGEADNRFIVRDGELHAAPMSPGDFIRTDLFSPRGKLRLLLEPFVPARTGEPDESLAELVERRFGREVLDYAVAPLVGGVFAGRPDALSARHALSTFHELEEDWGSVFLGMPARLLSRAFDDEPSPEGRLFSFRGGSDRLVDALVDSLSDALRLESRVTGLRRDAEGWAVELDDSPHGSDRLRADAVVWTAPAPNLDETTLVDERGNGDELTTDFLGDVRYPPVSIVAMGYDRGDVDHPLDGFGVLVPEVEPYDVLGTLFMSSLFPDRAPDGRVLLSTFLGGTRAPELARLPDEELIERAQRDVADLVDARGDPEFVEILRWEHAIPQYHVGYGDVLDGLDRLERRAPGLHLAGGFRDGIAVPDLIAAGDQTAQRLADTIGQTAD